MGLAARDAAPHPNPLPEGEATEGSTLPITWRLAGMDYGGNAARIDRSEVGCQETPEHNRHKNKTSAAEQDRYRHPWHIHQNAIDGIEAGHGALGMPRIRTHHSPAD